MTFTNLGIIEPILKAVKAEGYITPTPIQEQAIPILLRGKDLLGVAQTGTGKTAAFAIPILQHLFLERQQNRASRGIRALIVTPTRELAIQIGESFTAYGRFTGIRNTVIFGGVKQNAQTQALERGTEVLVATPGRLLDLIGQGYISLDSIGYFVLDEADRMLDMGFIHDIRKIIAQLPLHRQSLFFSATMPPDIVELSRKILGNPEKVSVKPEQTTAERVEQSVYFVSKPNKLPLLTHIIGKNPGASVLVFSRTKHGADKIVRMLKKAGIDASAIHGNKSQGARLQALGDFKNRDKNVLVATDIAARGIDIEELQLVVNYDLPNIPETYVHRIGRTARAGAGGAAVSFCDDDEKPYLRDIQKLISQIIPVIPNHPFTGDPESEPDGVEQGNSHDSRTQGQRRPGLLSHGEIKTVAHKESTSNTRRETNKHIFRPGEKGGEGFSKGTRNQRSRKASPLRDTWSPVHARPADAGNQNPRIIRRSGNK
jgi:ATP-dependent RNA helicase RhlE